MWKVVLAIFCILLLGVSGASPQTGKYRSGIFLSHSTGQTIWGPNGSSTSVPQEIIAYNRAHGLIGLDSVTLMRRDWPETPWNNEWERWHRIFDNNDVLADILPILTANKIVMIKSCFPSSELTGIGGAGDTLSSTLKTIYNYKWHWRNFIAVMKEHSENFFVVWTNAPRTAATTSDQAAMLSNQFCTWAKDTLANGNDALCGTFPPNVYVFDFFHKLADSSGKLPLKYAAAPDDPHPNSAATALVAPQLVQEIFDAAIAYENGAIVPNSPVLCFPLNSSIVQTANPVVMWSQTPNATMYELQVSLDSLFTEIIIADSSLTDTLKQLGPLDYPAVYFWRVRAKNIAGASDWSVPSCFNVAFYPMTPELLSPEDGATDQPDNLLFQWRHCSGATQYHLQISTDSLFNVDIINDSLVVDTFLVVGNLEDSTKYYWRIRAENIVGASDWAGGWSFITASYTLEYNFDYGWNLISMPLVVHDPRTSQLFPFAISNAFEYEGSYIQCDTLRRGFAYWLKINQEGILGVAGTPVFAETIAVTTGWNMIGSISSHLAVSDILSEPEQITTSNFFSYNGSYEVTDSVLPGRGYWIKVDRAGQLILSPVVSALSKNHIQIKATNETPPAAPDDLLGPVLPLPNNAGISYNYPNPFNPITFIYYQLRESQWVKLRVYSQLGNHIQTLVDEVQGPGIKCVQFNAQNLASGVYIYILDAGKIKESNKMILIK